MSLPDGLLKSTLLERARNFKQKQKAVYLDLLSDY